MGFFGDIDKLLQVPETLVRIEESLQSLHLKVGTLMADVRVTQEALNDLDTSLDEVAANLAAHIEALNLPEGDLSELQADVEALRALSAPAPAEPPAEGGTEEQPPA